MKLLQSKFLVYYQPNEFYKKNITALTDFKADNNDER